MLDDRLCVSAWSSSSIPIPLEKLPECRSKEVVGDTCSHLFVGGNSGERGYTARYQSGAAAHVEIVSR